MPPAPKILVIDDDDDLRDAICSIVELGGYRVSSSAQARAALDTLGGDDPPSLILLDLMMPDMDGWQFRAEQKKRPTGAAIPVVVITASRNLDKFPIDAAAVVLKPFRGEHLLDVIHRHVA